MGAKNKMSILAQQEKRNCIYWGVIHSGNAMVHSIHTTKKEAEKERKENAFAYVVIRVLITPLYNEEIKQ
ncbi:MAG: hypothetical protein V1709_00935 [Planctomycetota bacterium]